MFERSENYSGVQSGVILQQRVHIQQVVLDGGTSDCPACFSPQLTHSHGSLHFRVLNVVSLIKNHTSPGYTQERRQLRPLKAQRYTRRSKSTTGGMFKNVKYIAHWESEKTSLYIFWSDYFPNILSC